jgi:hypothetical protein
VTRRFARDLACLAATGAAAGEIPGLPGNVPLRRASDLEFGFYNDFLARGGVLADFRTR